MYIFNVSNVKGRIVGSGDAWLIFIETDNGLWQIGGSYASSADALAALGAR